MASVGQANASSNNALMIAAGNNAGAASLAQGNIWGNSTNQLAALYGRYAGSNTGISDTQAYQSHADEMARLNGQLNG